MVSYVLLTLCQLYLALTARGKAQLELRYFCWCISSGRRECQRTYMHTTTRGACEAAAKHEVVPSTCPWAGCS